ncbi:hypothetical protein OHC33_010517 [Knufia fluminis]|uniref:Protein kinase domain-containing protein n=1 Tax=Knufia fluminis TaxID=191047 RepID=A0AAN8E8Y1_9EURO|nr:hypothetical protein OHC33_010517 [Knufia fluminis]
MMTEDESNLPYETLRPRPLSAASFYAGSLGQRPIETEQRNQPRSGDASDDDSQPLSETDMRDIADRDRCWVSWIYGEDRETFEGYGSEWAVGKAICEEKQVEYYSKSSYARGVFECTRTGDDTCEKAVMKIYLQTDGEPENCPQWIEDEITALKRVAVVDKKNTICAPKLIAAKTKQQQVWSFVPNGYVTFIVMSFCPGEQLYPRTFYSWPMEKRNLVRSSFKSTIQSLWQAGVHLNDHGIHNLLWDDSRSKCYIVDFEAAKSETCPLDASFDDYFDFDLWDLVGWRWQGDRFMRAFTEQDDGRVC